MAANKMINVGEGLYVKVKDLEIYKADGRKKEFWCKCKDIRQLIRFISTQVVYRELNGQTVGIKELDDIILEKIPVIEDLVFEENKDDKTQKIRNKNI